jgi:hypothetical protein
MSTYVEAPTEFTGGGFSLFLAGGITGCPDWQREAATALADLPVILLNPRRENFPIDDPVSAPEQVEWEYRHLRRASAILFWFPQEALCPIALYELGAWSMTDKTLFVGAHPLYARRTDVVIQTRLVRPDVQVVFALGELLDQVRRSFSHPPAEAVRQAGIMSPGMA